MRAGQGNNGKHGNAVGKAKCRISANGAVTGGGRAGEAHIGSHRAGGALPGDVSGGQAKWGMTIIAGVPDRPSSTA